VHHDDDDIEHWTVWAACRGVDPELFYPVSAAGPAVVQVEEAKAVCARCLVRSDCLTWALRVGEPDGIWGGTTPDERRYLRRREVAA
jgi:WhiB family redox-sensing transcriptional regulator